MHAGALVDRCERRALPGDVTLDGGLAGSRRTTASRCGRWQEGRGRQHPPDAHLTSSQDCFPPVRHCSLAWSPLALPENLHPGADFRSISKVLETRPGWLAVVRRPVLYPNCGRIVVNRPRVSWLPYSRSSANTGRRWRTWRDSNPRHPVAKSGLLRNSSPTPYSNHERGSGRSGEHDLTRLPRTPRSLSVLRSRGAMPYAPPS